MDFSKIMAAITELQKATEVAPAVKSMTAVDFVAYIREQVAAAKTESVDDKDTAKARLNALVEQIKAAESHNFEAGALDVSVFEKTTTEGAANSSPTGETASNSETPTEMERTVESFKSTMDDLIAAFNSETESAEGEPAENTGDQNDAASWPDDLTKSVDEVKKPMWGFDREPPPSFE